ncbi:hypothetical protein Tco_0753093 [Tanacetum coccineum]
MDRCWNGSNGSDANNYGNKVSGIVQKIIGRCGSGFGGGKRKHRFTKGYMTGNDNFIGVKIKATIAKMISNMSQKYGRCGTWSKFVICIYMWITKASKNTKDTIIGLRTKQAGKGYLVIDDTGRCVLGAEVRMRAKHTLEKKSELEDRCAEQTLLLSKRDAEIARPKSLLSLKETEAAKAIRLHVQLTTAEAAGTAKDNELRDLIERNFFLEGERDVMSEEIATIESANVAKEVELTSLSSQVTRLTSDLSDLQLSHDELNSQVASLDSERDGLISQRSSLESAFELFRTHREATQDEQAKVLGTRDAELDAQLLEMAAHLDEEFYPHFLTAISGRRWILTHGLKLVILKFLRSPEYCHALGTVIGCAINKGIQDGLRAGIDHVKAIRDLSIIEAYDPSAEAKYVEAVNALDIVDFSLLSELKSKKDASIVVHSRVQRVKGEILEKLLSLTDVMVPLAEPLSSQSVIGEASTSTIPTTTGPIITLSITFASSDVIPPLATSNDQALDVEPNNEDPLAVTFEREELVTSPE